MSMKINLGAWNSIFAVPSSVVDEGLKFSDGVKLKVLLYLLRHSGEDVNESDISKVGEGDSVRITTLAYPEDVIAGKIDKVYNMLDEESKTMSVRVKLDNRDYKLKPGMFTQVRVCGRGTGKERLCVPSHALVFENGRYYVVTVASDDRLAVSSWVECRLFTSEKMAAIFR